MTRKDALVQNEIVAAARGQRDMGAMNRGEAGRKGAAKHSTGRSSQQFDIIRGKAINFEFEKPRRRRTCPCEAIWLKYSVVLSYSKQVIYLPPSPVGNGGYQG